MIAVTERSSQETKYPKANGAKTRTQNPNRGIVPAGEPLVFVTPDVAAPGEAGRCGKRAGTDYRIPSFSPRRRSARLSVRRRARVSSRLAMPTQTS